MRGVYAPLQAAETSLHIIIDAGYERGGFVHYIYCPLAKLWAICSVSLAKKLLLSEYRCYDEGEHSSERN